MGRLEDIIARNLRPNRPRERLVVMVVFGAILLLILGLMVFTDLGLPPGAERGGTRLAPGQGAKRVDGVLLRGASRPATGSAAR